MACTLIGCSDQFSATIVASTTDLPAGTHMLTVTTTAETMSCSFVLPRGDSAAGATAAAQCSPGLTVLVGTDTICTETTTDAARILTCEPVPGKFKETITVAGTPTSVHIQQSVDGIVILDRSMAPTYKQSRPNGPDCGPVCTQARVDLTIP